MNKEKPRCQHLKIPAYTAEERAMVEDLNAKINSGDTSAYAELTKLAVEVALRQDGFYRETCENCK